MSLSGRDEELSETTARKWQLRKHTRKHCAVTHGYPREININNKHWGYSLQKLYQSRLFCTLQHPTHKDLEVLTERRRERYLPHQWGWKFTWNTEFGWKWTGDCSTLQDHSCSLFGESKLLFQSTFYVPQKTQESMLSSWSSKCCLQSEKVAWVFQEHYN